MEVSDMEPTELQALLLEYALEQDLGSYVKELRRVTDTAFPVTSLVARRIQWFDFKRLANEDLTFARMDRMLDCLQMAAAGLVPMGTDSVYFRLVCEVKVQAVLQFYRQFKLRGRVAVIRDHVERLFGPAALADTEEESIEHTTEVLDSYKSRLLSPIENDELDEGKKDRLLASSPLDAYHECIKDFELEFRNFAGPSVLSLVPRALATSLVEGDHRVIRRSLDVPALIRSGADILIKVCGVSTGRAEDVTVTVPPTRSPPRAPAGIAAGGAPARSPAVVTRPARGDRASRRAMAAQDAAEEKAGWAGFLAKHDDDAGEGFEDHEADTEELPQGRGRRSHAETLESADQAVQQLSRTKRALSDRVVAASAALPHLEPRARNAGRASQDDGTESDTEAATRRPAKRRATAPEGAEGEEDVVDDSALPPSAAVIVARSPGARGEDGGEDDMPATARYGRQTLHVPGVVSPLTMKGRTPNSARLVSPRQRRPFTMEEEENLRRGVQKFGFGKWAVILHNYQFLPGRTSVNLKDKWRNMEKAGTTEGPAPVVDMME